MVKNKKGGKGHKKMARKNVKPAFSLNRKVRKVQEEGEMYARIIKMNGGGHATILCADKKERTLVIRGKFRGRNKRDNNVTTNSIVMVGLRSVSFGEVVAKKKEKADLIYVYNQYEMNELKKIDEVYEIMYFEEDDIDDIEFTNSGAANVGQKQNTKISQEDLELNNEVMDVDWDEI